MLSDCAGNKWSWHRAVSLVLDWMCCWIVQAVSLWITATSLWIGCLPERGTRNRERDSAPLRERHASAGSWSGSFWTPPASWWSLPGCPTPRAELHLLMRVHFWLHATCCCSKRQLSNTASAWDQQPAYKLISYAMLHIYIYIYIYIYIHYTYTSQHNLHEHAGSIGSPHLLTLLATSRRLQEEEGGQQQQQVWTAKAEDRLGAASVGSRWV